MGLAYLYAGRGGSSTEGGHFPAPVVGAFTNLGAQRPGGPACPAGVPISPEKWGERGPGLRPWTPVFHSRSFPLAGFCGGYLCNDRGAISSGMLRPIWDAFSRGNILESIFVKEGFQPAPLCLHAPKPSPWGEGGPAKPGRMRGRFGTQPFLVEKGVTDSRPDRLLLLPRWATRSPPHPSPSVTASPQVNSE